MTLVLNKPMNKTKLYDKNDLENVTKRLLVNIQDLFLSLGIKLKCKKNKCTSVCPLHIGADNPRAFNLDIKTGKWACYTHGCHNVFGRQLLGFIRGCMSKEKGWEVEGDNVVGFDQVIQFVNEYLGCSLKKCIVDDITLEKREFTELHEPKEQTVNKSLLTRELLRKKLRIPADYYLERGYTREVLDRYDVGLCYDPSKPFFNRIVVPIYDNNHKYVVGCTGRSIFDECQSCKSFHNPEMCCPSSDYVHFYPKWKNTTFLKEKVLFNYWFAKHEIQRTGVAIILESVGNVLRAEQARFKNSVGILGCYISDEQISLLNECGTITLITLFDNDDAGREATAYTNKLCAKKFNIVNAYPDEDDLGNMQTRSVKKLINSLMEKI